MFISPSKKYLLRRHWKEAGYKSQLQANLAGDLLPEKSVANITNIGIEAQQIVIAINLRIPTTKSLELSSENLNGDI